MQFGFRSNYSTESANCLFVEKVKCLLDRNMCVGAVFLDLRKAFDTVDHQVLLFKLTNLNFSEEAILWIKPYLFNRKQCVCINGTKSSYLACPKGVPQGSILGPILFSLYINDLPGVCKDVNVQLYADDVVIFTHANNFEKASTTLTSAMTNIQEWLTKSGLVLNTKKTVCMMFAKQPVEMTHSKVFLRGEELDFVTEFTYLGVTLDSALTFKSHVKKL